MREERGRREEKGTERIEERKEGGGKMEEWTEEAALVAFDVRMLPARK